MFQKSSKVKEDNKTNENSQPVINEPKKKVKYLEIWGDAYQTIFLYRTTTIIASGISILLMILLWVSLNKPPVVIQVDKLGYAQAIENWQSNSGVTPPEVLQVTKTFLKYFYQNDYYTYENDYKEAIKMMIPDIRESVNAFIVSKNYIEDIKSNHTRSKLSVSKIAITKNTSDNISVKATIYLVVSSYNSDVPNKTILSEVDIAYKKVRRTNDAPNGVLIYSFNNNKVDEK